MNLLLIAFLANGLASAGPSACHDFGDAIDNEPARLTEASNGKDGAILKEIDDDLDSYGPLNSYFDRNGRLIRQDFAGKTSREWGYSGSGMLPTSTYVGHQRHKIERNAEGVILRDLNSDGSVYDESSVTCNGDKVVITTQASDGSFIFQDTYSAGHLVETLRHFNNGSNSPEKTTWTYRMLPGGKRSVEERGFVGDQSAMLSDIVYQADERVEEKWVIDPGTTLKFGPGVHWELPPSDAGNRTVYTYKDDEHGNWISRLDCFPSDDNLGKESCVTTKRTIKYW